ncbi:MAG: copper chaperone PCu(A)C, partial [Undibacterium sp.]|nr:copper chaperone PCu(A)C [Undibacterium sp.]
MKILSTILFSLLSSATCLSHAQIKSPIQVQNAWVRSTVTPQTATGAFLQITSPQEAKLVSASSPIAKTVGIHSMTMVGEVMQMREVAHLLLPAGKMVELKPGSYHIVLMGLGAAIKPGDMIPLRL